MNNSPVCSVGSGTLTGRVVLSSGAAGSVCECETTPGFFLLAAGAAAPCDVDQDGWVTDLAYQRLHSNSVATRANARCSVRRITDIALVNDAEQGMASQTKIVSAVSAAFPAGLELFESSRNDGSSGVVAAIGGSALSPRHVNAFTKACASSTGDFNDNLVEDVDENHQSLAMVQDTSLRPLYTALGAFGHFIETHEGHYVPMAADDPLTTNINESLVGAYVIAERGRAGSPTTRTVPFSWSISVQDYWPVCRRDTDRLYTDFDETSAVESWTGGDFAEYPNDGLPNGWRGMDHHSQFKCVTVVSLAEYGSATAQQRPQAAYWSDADHKLHRVTGGLGGGDVPLTWESLSCAYDGATDYDIATGAPGLVPLSERSPSLTCVPADPASTSVVWAMVGYDPRVGALYDHGCINECGVDTVTACPGYTTEFARGFTCDLNSTLNFGQLRCGCGDNYAGGSECDFACAGTELFTPNIDGIDPTTRAGTWICGGFAASRPQLAVGQGSLSFRGEISATTIDATTLTGTTPGGATVELRAR